MCLKNAPQVCSFRIERSSNDGSESSKIVNSKGKERLAGAKRWEAELLEDR
jgi:hypothetical protein